MDILAILNKTKFTMRHATANRKKIISNGGVGYGTMNLGTVHKLTTTRMEDSCDTIRNPELWECVKQYAKQIDPDFVWTTVTINKNANCSRHLDVKNNGTTMIVALGDFTGGRLILSDTGEAIDIRDKPYYFNGSKVYHETEPFTGTRYSLMFYKYGNAKV